MLAKSQALSIKHSEPSDYHKTSFDTPTQRSLTITNHNTTSHKPRKHYHACQPTKDIQGRRLQGAGQTPDLRGARAETARRWASETHQPPGARYTTDSPSQVLVKVLACGVCHSDSMVRIGAFGNGFPIVPGHEIIGEIAAVPSSEKRWKEGDRVGGPWHGGHDSKLETSPYSRPGR